MINIIPLAKKHIAEIVKIENESFTDPWSKKMFDDLFDNPFAVGFTAIDTDTNDDETEAEAGAEVAGYLIAHHMFSEIEIMNIAVKESKRHNKIATKLFDAVFEYANIENAKRVKRFDGCEVAKFILEVRPSNVGAVALYKKLGFEIDGTRKNYYQNPKEDAILMSLRLGKEMEF